jgi:hypothetical protein
VLAEVNPGAVFDHVSGQGTESSEMRRAMWTRCRPGHHIGGTRPGHAGDRRAFWPDRGDLRQRFDEGVHR